MIKHLLTAFLIFGFFISNAQDRQELFLRAEARLKVFESCGFSKSKWAYGYGDK
jgi:hypothetical protein